MSHAAGDAVSRFATTGLWYASVEGTEEVVNYMLDHNPNVNYQQALTNGVTASAFQVASTEGHVSVVRILITKGGVDPTIRDHNDWTALTRASFKGEEEMVKYLCSLDAVKADINNGGNHGWTSLAIACMIGEELSGPHPGVVKILIENGAEVRQQTKQGHLAWRMVLLPKEKAEEEGCDRKKMLKQILKGKVVKPLQEAQVACIRLLKVS